MAMYNNLTQLSIDEMMKNLLNFSICLLLSQLGFGLDFAVFNRSDRRSYLKIYFFGIHLAKRDLRHIQAQLNQYTDNTRHHTTQQQFIQNGFLLYSPFTWFTYRMNKISENNLIISLYSIYIYSFRNRRPTACIWGWIWNSSTIYVCIILQ